MCKSRWMTVHFFWDSVCLFDLSNIVTCLDLPWATRNSIKNASRFFLFIFHAKTVLQFFLLQSKHSTLCLVGWRFSPTGSAISAVFITSSKGGWFFPVFFVHLMPVAVREVNNYYSLKFPEKIDGYVHHRPLTIVAASINYFSQIHKRICTPKSEPKTRFQGINSAILCTLAGRYDNPVPYSVPSPHRLFKNSSTG